MPKVNCAIYTRKSTEHGLDMEFNSLQNQERLARLISFPKRLTAGSIIELIRTAALAAVLWNARA